MWNRRPLPPSLSSHPSLLFFSLPSSFSFSFSLFLPFPLGISLFRCYLKTCGQGPLWYSPEALSAVLNLLCKLLRYDYLCHVHQVGVYSPLNCFYSRCNVIICYYVWRHPFIVLLSHCLSCNVWYYLLSIKKKILNKKSNYLNLGGHWEHHRRNMVPNNVMALFLNKTVWSPCQFWDGNFDQVVCLGTLEANCD